MTVDSTKRIAINLTTKVSDRVAVALTVAHSGLAQGLEVAIFLNSDAVELSRKGTNADLESFAEKGGTLWICSSCLRDRKIDETEIIEAGIVADVSKIDEWVADGAQLMSYE